MRALRHPVAISVVAVVTCVTVFGVSMAVGSAATSAYPAQGGRWDRVDERSRTPYLLASPQVGSSTATEQQPRNFGVRSYQQLLNQAGATLVPDGIYGRGTVNAVAAYQQANALPGKGAIGYQTARSLLAPVVIAEASRVGEPAGVLMCHLAAESNLDAGAVGVNGSDLGVAQISLDANPTVTVAQAFDVSFSVKYMADRDAKAYKRYKNWRIATVAYNSPSGASGWARSGKPGPKADAYSKRIFDTCSTGVSIP